MSGKEPEKEYTKEDYINSLNPAYREFHIEFFKKRTYEESNKDPLEILRIYLLNRHADEIQAIIKTCTFIQNQIDDAPDYKRKTIAYCYYDLLLKEVKDVAVYKGLAWVFFVISLSFIPIREVPDDELEYYCYNYLYRAKGIKIIESGNNISDKTPDDKLTQEYRRYIIF